MTQAIWNAPLTFEDFLSPAQCRKLRELALHSGFEPATLRLAQGARRIDSIRNNQRAQLPAGDWGPILWRKIQALELPGLDGARPSGIPMDLRFYLYGPGERFKMHKDGPWTEQGQTSKATFLVYLDEGCEGGQTIFKDGPTIIPKTGLACAFPHPIWHEGAEITAGYKTVLRTDIFYA